LSTVTRHLIRVLGKKPFLVFGIVTFLIAALLAAINITSRHALKLYVEDQLRRTPWDLAAYNTEGFEVGEDIPQQVRSIPGVQRVESLAFLRAMLPTGDKVQMEVDGQPLRTPWLCMLAATDLSLLPPALRLALANTSPSAAASEYDENGAILALIGPESAIGGAFVALQGTHNFALNVTVNGASRAAFTAPLRSVMRADRDELNRWFMDQTGSVSFVPPIGMVLLMPYHAEALRRYDSIASGIVPADMVSGGGAYASGAAPTVQHLNVAEYVPEVAYLARLDRDKVISGWDIGRSLAQVRSLRDQVDESARQSGASVVVDSTTLVLLEQMAGIARIIGIVSLLVALPLLWVAWVLATNLSGLLMLNERRKLGLMRLRGIPGRQIGNALLLAIGSGGFVGGLAGLVFGSVLPLLVYERGKLPLWVLSDPQQLLLFGGFFVVTLVLALMVSRKLVRYATTISPLEASGRVAASEATRVAVRFGPLQIACLILGTYSLTSWIIGKNLSSSFSAITRFDQTLDFLGLPLFLYGVSTLLVSRRSWIQTLLAPIIKPIGGPLGIVALRHIAVKPHRTIGFLLIVSLMAAVSLYPTISSGSFQDKAVRGARVQIGSEWELSLNAPNLAGTEKLQGPLHAQWTVLQPRVQQAMQSLSAVPGVRSVTFMVEALLPNFYLPGYGFKGVPMYVLADPGKYNNVVYSEPELGMDTSFQNLLTQVSADQVLVSQPIADFWQFKPGAKIPLGLNRENLSTVEASAGGTLGLLPGMPTRTVTDRQGYVQARVDYLNYLFSNNAYTAVRMDNSQVANLEVLIPRVIALVNVDPAADVTALRANMIKAMPLPPLEVRVLSEEIEKVGSDMFIYLALENMKIYVVGGLLLALVAIFAVASANYAEDKRTLAMLRIRGTSPQYIWRFLMSMLLAPAVLGLILGGITALLAGYGLSNHIWTLHNVKSIIQRLPTHLIISSLTLAIAMLLVALLIAAASLFSWWVFRNTAHENIQEG
jgi:hypothetical protein